MSDTGFSYLDLVIGGIRNAPGYDHTDPRDMPWDNPDADLRGAVNQHIERIIEQGPNA